MSTNLNDLISNTNVRQFIFTTDLIKGTNYDKEKVNFEGKKILEKDSKTITCYHFEVDSESKPTYYDVYIYIKSSNEIAKTLCDCKQYRSTNSCKHIAASLIKYYDEMFESIENLKTNISNDILKQFVPQEQNTIKKELKLTLSLEFKEKDNYFYYNSTYIDQSIKLTIGLDKEYTLKPHVSLFKEAYENGYGEVYFGKNFTYDASKHFFNENDKKIIDAYLRYYDYDEYIMRNHTKEFLKEIKDTTFIVNNYKINGIKDEFPLETNLTKHDSIYELEFDLNNLEFTSKDDYEYIIYKGKMYHLTKKEQDLLSSLIKNKLETITITKDMVDTFTKGLLSVVRKNINIDQSVDDITLPTDIKTRLYFDLRYNYIIANVLFIYGNEEIDYFSKNDKILRDIDYEVKVVNDLLTYGFEIEDNKIILNDLDKEVEFLEKGLETLATKYEIFTTEKFKGIEIKKKTTITSMFGIGKDNILSYNFNLGNIDSSELVKIFDNIKSKKKYYRLKNGDILNLEDESLKELNDLATELELTDEEIIQGKGNIQKYRALYLDSLKSNKYNIIKTDNLFDNFIDNFYKYKDCELTLSSDELKILRNYQITGVKWLYNLSKTGFGGILADEMGLGKTIQVIYYLKQMLKDNPNHTCLIVVPTSLAYNWDHEFSLYGKDIKREIVVGPKEHRRKILKNIKKYNVLVTTYGLLREDEEFYKDIIFDTMVIDEAQNIKNNMAGITKVVKKINATTKFALTGTPLENSILELWSIFDFIMPGFLSSLTKFQTKYKIKDFDEQSEELLTNLSKQINPFILRRKKKDVYEELPDKLINDIYIDLLDEQKKLYVAELEKVKDEMENIIHDDGISKARFLILQLLTKLRQICIEPSIVYDDYNSGSNKIDTLLNITNEYINNGHKILIFSSFKTALNIVRDKLSKAKIKNYMLDGSVPSKNRIEMVDNFNGNDDVKVFLIMLKSGGTGLNLTSADVVIHLDLWWNPQAENQATDRAHRIGQKNTVEVIHLITKGTIEEKILELQNKKRVLSDKLIDGEKRDQNILANLTESDIKHLLSYENKD